MAIAAPVMQPLEGSKQRRLRRRLTSSDSPFAPPYPGCITFATTSSPSSDWLARCRRQTRRRDGWQSEREARGESQFPQLCHFSFTETLSRSYEQFNGGAPGAGCPRDCCHRRNDIWMRSDRDHIQGGSLGRRDCGYSGDRAGGVRCNESRKIVSADFQRNQPANPCT